MSKLIVVEGGMLSTIQDRGRVGYQQYGMPVAGSMDLEAMAISNLLVGNERDSAIIEMTVSGGTFRAEGDLVLAVFGADMPMKIGDREIPIGQAFTLNDGEELKFDIARAGFRAYLAVAGGFNIKAILGSKSTYLQGKLGGFKGRQLKSGDEIEINKVNEKIDYWQLPESYLEKYIIKLNKCKKEGVTVRTIEGPQEEYFTKKGLETFYSSTYNISNNSNRMGYRLEGERVEHKTSADIISDGIAFGSVQVAGDGQPMIMMADHQTTGGYTKICSILACDLPILSQMGPGTPIRFKRLSYDDGLGLYREWRAELDGIKDTFLRKDIMKDRDMKYDFSKIEKLIEAFNKHKLKSLEIKDGDFELLLSKEDDNTDKSKSEVEFYDKDKEASNANQSPENVDFDLIDFKEEQVEIDDQKFEVKAPISGMCYRAPGVGEKPFVELNDVVKKGQPLMILEAMKMMNEITSPVDGKIKEIHFKNEEKVEAGSLLFIIE